jgi:predicted ABC-type transport system involved in lysophospholipase L1 biosynthesis ATPase subunit
MGELLAVEGVWKGFSRGGQWTGVLEDVSFALRPGQVTAIVGGRLGGKTTLLKLAAGMERPDRGNVSFAGRRLDELTERSWARLLGHEIVWIDRDGPGLEVEISRFVGWPLALHGLGRREAERMARQALVRVGAQGCIGRSWAELSNWQRVLVGLARAFAGSPRIVIIDDLLDALGSRATEEASDLLRLLVEESAGAEGSGRAQGTGGAKGTYGAEEPGGVDGSGGPRCAVLMSASDVESALLADQVLSLTRKGTLKPLSGQPPGGGEAEVIPFPVQGAADHSSTPIHAERDDSHDVGRS